MSPETFVLTADLVKLLRASWVMDQLSEVEYGAAEIDGKRPYGNTDVERDIAVKLGWVATGEDVDEVMRARAADLHTQTPTALQVILDSGGFAPGAYQRKPYGGRWELVTEDPS